jgi:hypothetical protein
VSLLSMTLLPVVERELRMPAREAEFVLCALTPFFRVSSRRLLQCLGKRGGVFAMMAGRDGFGVERGW